jgi:hypothetical protein
MGGMRTFEIRRLKGRSLLYVGWILSFTDSGQRAANRSTPRRQRTADIPQNYTRSIVLSVPLPISRTPSSTGNSQQVLVNGREC